MNFNFGNPFGERLMGSDVGITDSHFVIYMLANTPRNFEEQVIARTRPPTKCRYFLRGNCHFGARCRYSHEIDDDDELIDSATDGASTSRLKNWVDAPVFVPSRYKSYAVENTNNLANGGNIDNANENAETLTEIKAKDDAVDVVENLQDSKNDINVDDLNASDTASALPYERCEMCGEFCLHPNDMMQRNEHNQACRQQHEQEKELSIAYERSKDKECGICFDKIMDKLEPENRFGILPKCWHIFCLECIRTWRQSDEFEPKVTRACPECRAPSDFVCPSAFWVDTIEKKDKLLSEYIAALGLKDCKYFRKGAGTCPFGNKCFYKHALPNGELVDVGCPQRRQRLRGLEADILELLGTYVTDPDMLEFLSSESENEWVDF